jgi:hypothetical protein
VSLNWRTDEGSPARETATAEGNGQFTFAVCMALAIVGIPNITETNVGEVLARINFVEAVSGHLITEVEDGKSVHGFQPKHVLAYVGLSTNVSKESEASFLRRISSSKLRDLKREAEHAVEEAAQTA